MCPHEQRFDYGCSAVGGERSIGGWCKPCWRVRLLVVTLLVGFGRGQAGYRFDLGSLEIRRLCPVKFLLDVGSFADDRDGISFIITHSLVRITIDVRFEHKVTIKGVGAWYHRQSQIGRSCILRDKKR